jgi:hypothetical protein
MGLGEKEDGVSGRWSAARVVAGGGRNRPTTEAARKGIWRWEGMAWCVGGTERDVNRLVSRAGLNFRLVGLDRKLPLDPISNFHRGL